MLALLAQCSQRVRTVMAATLSLPTTSSSRTEKRKLIAGRYRIERLLAKGGMARVYLARDLERCERVALKIVRPDKKVPGLIQRFMAEARAAMKLTNEHVVRVFDVGSERDGSHYMVMELLEGTDLLDLLAERGRLPVELAVKYVREAAAGLAEAHDKGIVHRDLKPKNLFLARDAHGGFSIKVIDFGVSKLDIPLKDGGRLTEPGITVGSPGYMSPEQMRGIANITPRSDIWALGALLFELLSGMRPFEGESLEALHKAATTEKPLPIASLREDVPDELDLVIAKCLRPEPKDRFEDVTELAEALAPFAVDRRIERAHAAAIEEDESRVQKLARHRTRFVIGVTLLAVALASINIWKTPSITEPEVAKEAEPN